MWCVMRAIGGSAVLLTRHITVMTTSSKSHDGWTTILRFLDATPPGVGTNLAKSGTPMACELPS